MNIIRVSLCITKDSYTRISSFTDIVINHKGYYPDRDLPTVDFELDLEISFDQFFNLLCSHNIPFTLKEFSNEGKNIRHRTCSMLSSGNCIAAREEDITPFFWDDQISLLSRLGIEENLD